MTEPKKKIRIDQLLVDRKLAPSRARAQSYVMSGLVMVKQKRIAKPSELVEPDAVIEVKTKDHPFVSRGGVKLLKALKEFKINVSDCIGLDIGASTGGFTDCVLQNGGQKVYAVDVGYGQLDWKLQKDDRVVVIDRTNFRYFDWDLIEDKIDLITIDVSFISLTKIFPKIMELIAKQKLHPVTIIALIKPQFEAKRDQIGKKGIVRDDKVRQEIVEEIKNYISALGLTLRGAIPSPITGQDGNQEYLMMTTYSPA